jgi:hypothetical protein
MSANPHANGGELMQDLVCPDFRDYAIDVLAPGTTFSEPTRVLGGFLRDIVARNPSNFRIFGPDETASNRLDDVFEVTGKVWEAEIVPNDENLAPRAGSSRCSRSISARAGSRATSSPAGTGSSIATRLSSTSSTRCSTSTPSG